MLVRLFQLCLISICLATPAGTPAQIPALPLPGSTQTAAPPVPQPPPDSLGRSNPRSMMRELIRALDRQDYKAAARYMQLTREQQRDAESLGQQLRELLNCCFAQPIASISDAESGTPDDGLPLDQQRIGPLKIGDYRPDIILVHVSRPDGTYWLLSSMTLEQVPVWYRLIRASRIQRVMPLRLQQTMLWGLSLAHWIVWIGTLLVPLLAFRLLAILMAFILRLSTKDPDKRTFVIDLAHSLKWPVLLILTLITHLLCLPWLGFPLQFRIIDSRASSVGLIVLVAIALRRLVSAFAGRARLRLLRSDRRSSASILLMGERLIKVLINVAAAFIVLTAAGVDTKTALTGLGIGGIAIAFGAQKTIENLLGGILLISDQAIAVGDMCSISDRVGTIEDISLRSVRMRTLEQTLLLIPAGVLSQANIENHRSRTKMLMNVTLRLQYSATVTQITSVRQAIYDHLLKDPRVEGSTARVNLTDFGQWAIELQVWAYLLTSDTARFNSIREELLLTFAQFIEAAGCRIAIPAQTVYTHSSGQTGS